MIRRARGVFLAFSLGAAALILAACGASVPAEIAGDLPAELEAELEDGVQLVEFVGVVESMAEDSWTVSGVSFAVDPSAEIEEGFAVDDAVRVDAILDESDQLTAREIHRVELDIAVDEGDDFVQDDPDDDVEFIGVVENMAGSNWVVSGQSFAIVDLTEIEDAVVVGDTVKVHAFAFKGVLASREIELADEDDLGEDEEDDIHYDLEGQDDDEDELVGVVENIEGGTWTVSGVSFQVTSNTEIEDDVRIGDLVTVEFATDSNGGRIAEEIERADEDVSAGNNLDDDVEDDGEDQDEDQEHQDDDDDDDHDHEDEYEGEDQKGEE